MAKNGQRFCSWSNSARKLVKVYYSKVYFFVGVFLCWWPSTSEIGALRAVGIHYVNLTFRGKLEMPFTKLSSVVI